MNCRKALQFIYLSRNGELSPDELRELEGHLQSCPRCAREREAALAGERRVAVLRGVTPTVSDAAGLTRGIMQVIRRSRDAEKTALRRWEVFPSPQVRVALGMALVAIAALFFYQTVRDAQHISSLEGRLSARNSDAFLSTSDVLREQGAKLAMAGSLSDILLIVDRMLPGIAHKEGATALQNFAPLTRERITIEQYIRSTYPGLSEVRLDDGLDRRERELLETEGKALLRDLEAWSRKE